jgi:hypothetical protein
MLECQDELNESQLAVSHEQGVQMCSSSSNAETKALFKLMDALFMAFAALLTLTFRDCVF